MATKHTDPTEIHVPDFELVRRIGSGAYGDVWLGRSATGVYRAVKVLSRAAFGEDTAPFEREFQGLRRFETISREHQNLVDILHIGRTSSYLYYVMELADDFSAGEEASGIIDPRTYQADTLRQRIKRCGSLRFDECMLVSHQLGDGLQHLHENGLVHRDVKPGNIVFVRGIAKLADVGLVTDAEATVSIVGTEGYIPPEGPGTPAADVFALGKVLYEISTGHDRMEFPALGEGFMNRPGRKDWLEFNEVVLKAAESDSRKRYTTAAQLVADVQHLEQGKSLVRQRRFQAVARHSGKGLVVMMMAIALGWGGIAIEQWRRDEAPPPELARSWDPSFVPLGRTKVSIRPMAYRTWDVSPDGRWFVIEQPRGLLLRNRESEFNETILRDHPEGWLFHCPRWMADGNQIICGAQRDRETEDGKETEWAILAIDRDTPAISAILHQSERRIGAVAIDRASESIATIESDDEGHLLVGREGSSENAFALWDGFEGLTNPKLDEFSPNGKWLSISARREGNGENLGRDLFVIPVGGGGPIQVTSRDGMDFHSAWSPDGKHLYYVSGNGAAWDDLSWNLKRMEFDLANGKPVSPPAQLTHYDDSKVVFPSIVAHTFELIFGLTRKSEQIYYSATGDGHDGRPIAVGGSPILSHDGEWLYYLNKTDSKQGIYRKATTTEEASERLTTVTSLGYDLSPDGTKLVYAVESESERGSIFLLDLDTRDVTRLASITNKVSLVNPVWSPDGSQIAWNENGALFVSNLRGEDKQLLGSVGAQSGDTPIWSPDGTRLAMIGSQGDNLFPVYVITTASKHILNVSTNAERLYKEGLSWHPSGEWLTYMHYLPDKGSAIKRAFIDGRPEEVMIETSDHWEWVGNWHPDGRRFFFISYALTEEHEGGNLHVYDLESGEISHSTISNGTSWIPQWSADGTKTIWSRLYETWQLCVINDLDSH